MDKKMFALMKEANKLLAEQIKSSEDVYGRAL